MSRGGGVAEGTSAGDGRGRAAGRWPYLLGVCGGAERRQAWGLPPAAPGEGRRAPRGVVVLPEAQLPETSDQWLVARGACGRHEGCGPDSEAPQPLSPLLPGRRLHPTRKPQPPAAGTRVPLCGGLVGRVPSGVCLAPGVPLARLVPLRSGPISVRSLPRPPEPAWAGVSAHLGPGGGTPPAHRGLRNTGRRTRPRGQGRLSVVPRERESARLVPTAAV